MTLKVRIQCCVRIFWKISIALVCFFILAIVLFKWYCPNWSWSYQEIIQEVLSPDGNTWATIKIDAEDDPYYIFELNRKTPFGNAAHLGDCQIPRNCSNTEYSILQWQDNRYFLLQVSQNGQVSQTIRIETAQPVFPCLKPFEDPSTPLAKSKKH